MNNLACIYIDGVYVEKDIATAISLLRKSTQLANFDSTNIWAHLYLDGTNVEKDINRAIELFEFAIDNGSTSAMTNLAQIYEYGVHVDKNILKACELYALAAGKGCDIAKQKISHMFNDTLKFLLIDNLSEVLSKNYNDNDYFDFDMIKSCLDHLPKCTDDITLDI